MVYAISFAKGQPFERYLKFNAFTARIRGGADKVISYTYSDIPQEYIQSHSEIFKFKRGAGLWLWKSYFVDKTLSLMNEGEWLFYSDAGCFFVDRISKLTKYAEETKQDILLFGLPLLNRQFCKRECYEMLDVKDNGENQAVGTFFLIRKTMQSVDFVKEWLTNCENINLISPYKMRNDIDEFPDFYAHREDQALLSLLAIKYKIRLNRDCSNFGVFPYDYCYKEFDYRPIENGDETYGVVLISHRASNPLRFYLFYLRKRLLRFFGFKYTEKSVLNNKPSFSKNNRNIE